LDSLATVAEIGIALAGFSGLVVVLRKRSGSLNDIEKYRMSVLLATAFGAMFLALLPGALQQLGLDDDVVWRASSGILTAFSLAFVLGWVLSSRRFFNVAREIFNVPAFSLMTIGHLINLVSQLSVTLGMWGDSKPGVYLLGLLWLLAHASQQFVRMLFVQPKPVGSSTDI
jgi:ABC-type iron transport system FetAB permease component